MATRDFVRTEGEGRTYRTTWPLAQGDDGAPVSLPGAADRTVQIFGTFGGATVALQGSLEAVSPSNWFNLVDAQGNAISFSAAGGEIVLEMTAWARPLVAGGDATTDLTFILLSRSTMG